MAEFTSAWVEKIGKVVYRRLEIPQIGATEVLVRVKACGICGSDIHLYRTYPRGKISPLGHEVAGIVEFVGSDVKNISNGQSVIVQNHVPCGYCESCLNQRYDACTNIQTYMDDQAGMGEYLVVPAAMVIPFDSGSLKYSEATLAEPITVALDLCREAEVRLHDNVLIMGPGTIGLSCIPLVKKQGARNIVVAGHDLETVRGKHRVETALSLGADLVVDTAKPDWKAKLTKQYPGLFDRVIVTSPPKTIADGMDLAGFRGWIVYDGISYTDDTVTFGANDFHFKKKRLIASHAIPNWGFPQALALLQEGTIPPKAILTHRYPLSDLAKALEDYNSKELEIIKVAVEID
ncbi:zinc-dependent alcohol dehydrogenase [Pleomorphochaeta sp. DL1XJH-081]|uniref:zinc-dependent alcohol dehydrogenase n=1 Tax=Pleomorphochaeta sp. DL1XJH-081 TaxID=3409690 RepID=UPI003BB63DC0